MISLRLNNNIHYFEYTRGGSFRYAQHYPFWQFRSRQIACDCSRERNRRRAKHFIQEDKPFLHKHRFEHCSRYYNLGVSHTKGRERLLKSEAHPLKGFSTGWFFFGIIVYTRASQFWSTRICGLKTRLSSSQSKGEKVFHRGILDHANFLDVERQRERQPQTNLYDLRDEGGGHVHRQCTVRSPAFWKVICPRRSANILQHLMDTLVQVEKACGNNWCQEHDSLL